MRAFSVHSVSYDYFNDNDTASLIYGTWLARTAAS